MIGFYHTHPSGAPAPSERDVRTMHAWVSAFGKPLLCVIETRRELHAYRYDDDASAGIETAGCELFPRGVVVVYQPTEPEPEP